MTESKASAARAEVESFVAGLRERNPGETEFHQAVEEVVASVMPVVLDRREYREANLLERLTEPDRIVIFRVVWEDDRGAIRTQRAWRVQFSNALGPYKGGLRFHPDVNQSVLKFLGFEQCLKNALTGLPMGGAKGGANFDPKGRSDREVMRFCQSLMTELHRHIGEDTDVPAGDIGVGGREISFLFGQYKRLTNRFVGSLTGKEPTFGGSPVRREATGYGLVYFAEDMLEHRGAGLEGKAALLSGSGNVALYAAEKLIQEGAKVLTLSDSGGFVHDPDGIDGEKLAFVRELKEVRRGRIREYAEKYPRAEFHSDARPWGVPAELAFPCATQNELSLKDAERLLANGVELVAEGANMPAERDAVHRLQDARILFAPSKAANAGGVAVSGLEQSQNAQRLAWDREQVDRRLREIMRSIHGECLEHGESNGYVNYVRGANVGGFVKLADALLAYGAV